MTSQPIASPAPEPVALMSDEAVVRGPCTFRKNDIKRAIAAAEIAGHAVGGLEIDKSGTIRLLFNNGDAANTKAGDQAALDQWISKHAS
jgi:hypothetical protein